MINKKEETEKYIKDDLESLKNLIKIIREFKNEKGEKRIWKM